MLTGCFLLNTPLSSTTHVSRTCEFLCSAIFHPFYRNYLRSGYEFTREKTLAYLQSSIEHEQLAKYYYSERYIALKIHWKIFHFLFCF